MNFFDFFKQNTSIQVRLNAPYGIHLRPSAMIANIAKSHNGKVFFEFNDIKIDAKDMNKILSLGLKNGDMITISANGKNSHLIVKKIATFLSTLTDEINQIQTVAKNRALEFEGKKINGKIISSGLGIGKPYYWQMDSNNQVANSKSFDNAYREIFDNLNAMSDNDIFAAQKALLETLPSNSFEKFEEAVRKAIEELRGSEHEAKIADYKDLLNSIISNMGNGKATEFLNDDFILFADELLPSDIVKLSSTNVKGVVVKYLPARSHAALLLRSHKIPTIVIDREFKKVDDIIILDGDSGYLVVNPTKKDIEFANKKINENKNIALSEHEKRFESAMTVSGKKIKVQANIADLQSAKEALKSGCDGIGLLRSEFLFQEKKPSLDEQCKAYSEIFELFDEVTVRTLDIGGDKSLPYIKLDDEKNPFLGIRGVRLLKTHKEIIAEQLLAILKAKRKKELKVMFPMVATVDEFIEAKELAITIAKENELNLNDVSFGIMIEVPSVLFSLEEFNKVVDFYSIGTNDLSQYLFAIDRTHSLLSIDSHSSVLYDALKLIADKASKPVSICGELASDEEAINRLINIGINTFSVPSQMVPAIKSRIRDV